LGIILGIPSVQLRVEGLAQRREPAPVAATLGQDRGDWGAELDEQNLGRHVAV
jgi:hypothetical protein